MNGVCRLLIIIFFFPLVGAFYRSSSIIFLIPVSYTHLVVYAVMDDTIKTEEDIEKYLGVSVLAKVPDRKMCIRDSCSHR